MTFGQLDPEGSCSGTMYLIGALHPPPGGDQSPQKRRGPNYLPPQIPIDGKGQ